MEGACTDRGSRRHRPLLRGGKNYDTLYPGLFDLASPHRYTICVEYKIIKTKAALYDQIQCSLLFELDAFEFGSVPSG